MPLSIVVPIILADMSIDVMHAPTSESRTTPAATGIVPNARAPIVSDGYLHVRTISCRARIFMLSLRYRKN